MTNEIYIDIDVKGASGHQYQGSFTLKRYLNQKDRNEVARITNRLTQGMRRAPTYSFQVLHDLAAASIKNSLSKVLLDSKLVEKYEESLNVDSIAYNVLMAILPELKDTDAQADNMYYLALLNVHIISAPEWWKPKGEQDGGIALNDFEPIADLYLKLIQAQKPVTEEASPENNG